MSRLVLSSSAVFIIYLISISPDVPKGRAHQLHRVNATEKTLTVKGICGADNKCRCLIYV